MNEKGTASPEYMRMSLAAAMTLGFSHGSFYRDAHLHCLNLLLDYAEGCYANCSYCGLARGSKDRGKGDSFIRVQWPSHELDQIINRAAARGGDFQRVCVSMVMHPRAFEDTVNIVERLDRELELPVSVLANPSSFTDGGMEALDAAGAGIVTIAIDAATEAVFEKYRGRGSGGPHSWDAYWRSMEEAAVVFGKGRFGCHLIVGLGETEQQMVETIQRVRDMGGSSHLFAFYPEQGSELEAREPCHPSQFRRIQLARFLIDYGMVDAGVMEYDEHQRLVGFGIENARLDGIVRSGDPFRTSGCPGTGEHSACNRPFGDGPASDIRSFPFALDREDIELVQRQMAIYREPRTEAGASQDIPVGS